MNKSDVANMYAPAELIPIVGNLTESFTSKESSSVTYERANQLMEAVLYCIAHCYEGNNLSGGNVLPAKEAYMLGFEVINEKVKNTLDKYNEMLKFFDHYGNRNYRDTVDKALPGFFMYYDARYAPTENIITMDYPVYGIDWNLEGIDIISRYIDAIWEEQCFLMNYPRSYIINKLYSFHPHYETEYFNIREIVELG